MTEKFTSGPWLANNDAAGLGVWQVWSMQADAADMDRAVLVARFEREEDAMLAAAAPELYAALKRALGELDCAADQIQRRGMPGHAEDIRITIDACGDALSKARGEK